MSEKLRESLSAIVDDEADEFELRRVLDELEKNPELKTSWDRYHLIGSVMRQERSQRADNLRERVWLALDVEQVPGSSDSEDALLELVSVQAPRRPWLGWMTGLAVAASVALAVIIGVGGYTGSNETVTPEIAEAVTAEPANDSSELPLEASVSAEERMAALTIFHIQQRAMNQPSIAAFAKLATYRRQ
jgi:sigma-E factor negative regulatory protein RseA